MLGSETDRLASLIVTLEMPAKILALFLVFLYVLWFWKVGPYDALMGTVQALRAGLTFIAVGIYAVGMWVFVSISRSFRVVFATVRDFFISRI